MPGVLPHYGSNIGNPIDIINRNRHFYRHGDGLHISIEFIPRRPDKLGFSSSSGGFKFNLLRLRVKA
jgi:hypothetical protein